MPPLKAMRSFPTARFQAFMSSLTWGMLLSLPENFFRVGIFLTGSCLVTIPILASP